MNKEEKEYKSAVLQLQTALDFHNSNNLGEYNVNWASVELILEYIENLQKKAELGDHYKHLYSEVKKKKDDVVEYINTAIEEGNYFEDDIDTDIQPANYDKYVNSVEILRMLGEIDDNNIK